MAGQRKDDRSFSLVKQRCHDFDKHTARTYVSDKVSEDPALNSKISRDEARLSEMLPSLRVWPTSYQFEVSLHAEHRCYLRGRVWAVGILPRKVSSEEMTLPKHELQLRSGILEFKTPTAF